MNGRRLMLSALAVVAILFIAVSTWIYRLDRQIALQAGPAEGYYWSVAQYQLEYLRAREAIASAADPDKISDDELTLRAAIFRSRKALLTEPSELTDSFRDVTSYPTAVARIREFHERIDGMLATPASIRANTDALLADFKSIEETIRTLASDSRMAEMKAKGSSVEVLVKRRDALWFATWACFALAVLAVFIMHVAWSRQKRMVEVREEALEAQRRAVRAKMQFLGMVSHELRSPLQSIVSALDVLESRRTIPMSEQTDVTRRIRRSANELTAQLRDMLTLARGEEGRIELRPEVFEACELVRETVEDLRQDARTKGLHFEIATPHEPMFVVADSVRIAQILQNLVGNAVRYAEPGAHVTVTLEAMDREAGHLRLRVSDTGHGLPDSALRTLEAGVEDMPGQVSQRRGLGLAVVRTLVQQLGGKIHVDSSEDSGTTFDLAIPVVIADDAPAAKEDCERRILVVDDRPELLTAFAQVCSDLRLICDTAPSAAAALNFLAAHTYGAVLVDLDMPGKTGVEFAAEVRRAELHRGARMVAMTAGLGPGRERLTAFDAVLEKPVGREQLAAVMQRRTNRPARPE